MTNTGGATIPAKEFEGKLWILADAYQQAMQAAYIGGVLAEREACALAAEAVVPRHTECGNKIAGAIRARGQQ
jgi:hypothetical protein